MKQWSSEKFSKCLQLELLEFEHQQSLNYNNCRSSPAGLKALGPQLGLDVPNFLIVWAQAEGYPSLRLSFLIHIRGINSKGPYKY